MRETTAVELEERGEVRDRKGEKKYSGQKAGPALQLPQDRGWARPPVFCRGLKVPWHVCAWLFHSTHKSRDCLEKD